MNPKAQELYLYYFNPREQSKFLTIVDEQCKITGTGSSDVENLHHKGDVVLFLKCFTFSCQPHNYQKQKCLLIPLFPLLHSCIIRKNIL